MTDEPISGRSASDVLWRHLELAEQRTVDDDLAERLARGLPNVEFEYDVVLVEHDVGFLAWRATASNGNRVDDGADSYVIRDGRIVAQSIHYTLQTPRRRPRRVSAGGVRCRCRR